MELPRNPITSPMDDNPLIERIVGSTNSWSRTRRLLLALPFLAATVAIAYALLPGAAFWLCLGYFGALHRWVIEDGERPRIADAWICAALTFPVACAVTWIAWTEPDTYPDLSTSDRLWWSLLIVTLALALDRVRRPATPTEALGSSLAAAGRRRLAERRKEEEAQ